MNSAILDVLSLAGRIMMESGGETYRVEETVTHMGRAFGLRQVETFAVPSGIFIGCGDGSGQQETRILRIQPGPTNLSRVDAVNQISRMAAAGRLTPAEAMRRLQAISAAPPPYTEAQRVLAAGVCAMGFTLMFAGGWLETLVSFLTAALVQAFTWGLARTGVQGSVSFLFRGFFTTLLPMAVFRLAGQGALDPTIGGALMPLLPGLVMTTGVQDLLRGDMVSGASHLLRATLIAAMVAGGALFAAQLMRLWGGMPA